MVRAEGGSLRVWGPGLLSTSPAFSMSSASHSAGSSGWLAQKTGAGPTFQWAGRVDAICRSRSNRAKRPRAGCILRFSTSCHLSCQLFVNIVTLRPVVQRRRRPPQWRPVSADSDPCRSNWLVSRQRPSVTRTAFEVLVS